jgi:hypothetical protein
VKRQQQEPPEHSQTITPPSSQRRDRPVSRQPNAALLDRDGFIESDELADYLRVPVATLDQWASRGGGPMFHKIGKFRRYHPADVRAWIAEQPRLAATGDPRPAA